MKRPELLSPAGNLEKLKIAMIYGADAVYCGGLNYGLRAGADNFTIEELKEGTEFVHKYGGKIYVTVNLIPHNEDLMGLDDYLKKLEEIGVDAAIVADPGVIRIIKNNDIKLPLFLSTQANAVNWQSVKFWQEAGISRIIMARELNKEEIKEISDEVDAELEMFIHGAMCISYSGRCLLSNYMINRDANRGECAHSCRWKYHLMEEKRPGDFYPVFEDERGTYIMNSRDLCLIEYIPELMNLGLDSFKIEGRMKSLHYVATVTSVYRQAFNEYYSNPDTYQFKPEWMEELRKISNRNYTTGFFLGSPGAESHNYSSSAYIREYDFVGLIRDYNHVTKEATMEVRNKIYKGDKIEILTTDGNSFINSIDYIINEEGERVEDAPHAQELIKFPVERPVEPYYLVRRRTDKNEGE